MKSLYYFFKLFIINSLIVSGANIKSQPSLVIGGELIEITEVPWQASIENHKTQNGGHWCGCTILNEEWVVTAGHCLFDKLGGGRILFTGDNVVIHAGSTDQTDNSKGQRVEVDEIILHPLYNNNGADYEIALMHLKKPLCYTNEVQPVNYANQNTQLIDGNNATISGWGSTGSGCCSPVLYGAEMPLFSDFFATGIISEDGEPNCPHQFLNNWLNNRKLFFWTDGIAIGDGDSGGPAVMYIDGEPTLVGIVSGHCPPNSESSYSTLPSIFGNVKALSPFIDANLAPKDITINTSQTNLARSVINGNIIVKSPAVLTINTNIYMMPGMEIIVENGAQLILDGGRITSIDGDCSQPAEDKEWKGIRAIGNPFIINQSLVSVEVKNGSFIENAVTGINTSNMVFGGMFGALNFSGAKISVENSSILNCNTGINIGPFGYYDIELIPGYNISSDDESYIQNTTIEAHRCIVAEKNRGLEVIESNLLSDGHRVPIGIWAKNSKISVTGTSFDGWGYPILANFSYPYPEGSDIINNIFTSHGNLHWDNNTNLVSPTLLHENDFEISGIFMVGSNRFDITKNTFYNGSSAVEVVGTGALNESYIKNNLCDGVAYGVYANGENGTEINDNCFEQIAKDNVQLYDEAQIFYDQGDFENAAGNCFDKNKPIFKFGNNAEGFEYWIKEGTLTSSCEHPGSPNVGEPWTLIDEALNENPDDCGNSGFSGGGGWNYGYRKCNVPDSIHLMINMETSLKNQIIAIQNNSGLSEWAKKRELVRLRRCLKSVIGKITAYRLITETDREATINYLSVQDIFEIKIGAYGLMMHSGEYSRADSFLTTLTYTTDAELDFKETQQIYLDFLSHRDTSLVDALDKNVLYTIGNKKHGYAGFARSVYSEITGEIIPVTTPKLGEPGPRTRKENFTQHWTVSPNPFHSLLRVNLLHDSESKIDITVYNTLGMIQHHSFDTSNMTEIQTDSWSRGVYFIEVKINNKIQGFSKLVKL
ncbi:MAG: trypsin-like serine protease [Saprospiraceae bacterium]|nr:trypsin-like serine protease [Saprospiraceae bacterium]